MSGDSQTSFTDFDSPHTCLHCLNSFSFASHHLVPLGSRPRVVEKERKGGDGKSHDLFGPVAKYFCWSYDIGMVAYLGCLKEFADMAHEKDVAEGREETFCLPYEIEVDKVNGMTVKCAFNNDSRWTKALKYMLADLSCCVKWLVEKEVQQHR